MNTNNSLIDQGTLTLLYNRYKPYYIPSGIIVVCIGLFLFAIIPQINNLFTLKKQLEIKQQHIAIMEQNIRTLSTLNQETLDKNFSLVSSALPGNKDFVSILTTINNAAATAGVVIGDYSFALGDLSLTTPSREQVSLQLGLTLTGNLANVKQFVVALQNQFPLSEISELQMNGESNSYSLNTLFYYRPYGSLLSKQTTLFSTFISKDQAALTTLSAFEQNTSAPVPTDTPIPTVTSIPTPTSTPTPSLTPSVTETSTPTPTP